MSSSTSVNGRQAQARVNDDRILDAARAVFLADPTAPITDVARRAGVGISALYRRYEGKDALLRALARDGLQRYAGELRVALADRGDVWAAYCACLHRVVDGGSQGLAQRLAGTFEPSPDLGELAIEAGRLYTRLHRRAQRAKALRAEVSTADVTLLLEMLMSVELPGRDGGRHLRHRYLDLYLQALHRDSGPRLPGPAADERDLGARWRPAAG